MTAGGYKASFEIDEDTLGLNTGDVHIALNTIKNVEGTIMSVIPATSGAEATGAILSHVH